MDIWRNLSNLKPDVLLIRGAETDTFWASTARRFKKGKVNTQIISVPGSTHLVPLEKPGLVSDAIIDFLSQ
jgi:pimeloyl-ACP methyl ester carboxylesterase